MEIREIRSLILVAETRSILQAAGIAGLTPGAIHKHLKTLESELGVALYEKAADGLRLTPPGLVVLPFFKDVLERREAAVAALNDWRQSDGGIVRVGAGPSFASYMLPSILSKYRRRYRRAQVYVETGSGAHLLEQLESGALDVIFDLGEERSAGAGLAQSAVWEVQVAILSALPHVPPHTKMRQLAKVPFILFRQGSQMDRLIQRYFDEFDFRPNVVMRSDSAEAIKAAVKGKVGVAMLMVWNANQELRNRSLKIIHTEGPPLKCRMVLLQRRTSYTPRAVQAFIEMARAMDWPNLHHLAREPG